MTLKEFKEILLTGSDKAKHTAMSNAAPKLLNIEIFHLLFKLLKHNDSQYRFFAIFHLIDKYSESLTRVDNGFIDDIYNALLDEFPPVSERATWALSIIGDKALDQLLEKYSSETIAAKIKITYAIGRGNFSIRSKDRVKVLLAGLKSENQELKFIAMCELMTNTPISPWSESKWSSTQDKSIDFEDIYTKISPVAKEFSKRENKNYKSFANKYINWIENRNHL